LPDEEFLHDNEKRIAAPGNSMPIKISDDSDSNEILVFTSFNNVYKVPKKEIRDIHHSLEKIDFEKGEKAIYVTGEKSYLGISDCSV